MQNSSSSPPSSVESLSVLVAYANTFSDQCIQPKDIIWALDLPCAPPVLNFLAELIASEDDSMPERTSGLDREERETWDKAVQAGLVNAEPSDEADLELSEPYLTPAQLRELTTYDQQIITIKEQQIKHVLARNEMLQETYDQISSEINESRQTRTRLGEKIRDVEASLLEFSIKMNYVLLPQLTAQLSLSFNPKPLQNELNHLIENLSTNLPTPPFLPSSRAPLSRLSPESLERETFRISDSLRSLLRQKDVLEMSSDDSMEKIWEREMEEILRRMDDEDFGSDDEDENEWEVEGQESSQGERAPMTLVKELIEGAWEWDMMDELENSIERARNAKTTLTEVQLPILLLLQTTLQTDSEQTLSSLDVWQAIQLEMNRLRIQKVVLNSKGMVSTAELSNIDEEGLKWKESIWTILRSNLTTSTPFLVGKTVELASFDDVLAYLHSLKAQVCWLRTQTNEELDRLIRGGTFKSQRIFSVPISSQAPTPLHSTLEPPKEIRQAKDSIQKMMHTVEGLVREWVVLGESLGKNKEGKKQITRFVAENTMRT
ncbi:hypothetical protein [Phaffia rhodozyma]|uniref:Uncharacterized protein n=1 Tax=Phaffia rhodozyma TaxID=264483 RepID=A0A0F7SP78_PHARH|nr:hypothetical protein [Phaffia rhodozyma]